MRKFERTKKLLSVLLAVVMVLSYVPVRAMAEECSHHSHDENCGYKEAKEGSACTHQHTESCTEEVTVCIHVHSEEAGCVFTPAAEAVACDHDCANGDCGYVAAQEAVPCTCGAQPQHDAVCASVTTEGAECNCTTTLTHGEGCEPKEAVAEVACDHTHGSCAYREAVEESWSCDHTCAKDNGCITVKENCSHVCPADDCGFVEAVEASPCTFVCEECLNEDVCPECESTGGAHSENCLKAVCPFCGNLNEAHSETCSTRCTSAEGCIDGQHGAECPLYICSVCNTKPCVCSTPELTDTDDGCGYGGCTNAESHLFLLHESGSEVAHEMQQTLGFRFGCTIWFYDAQENKSTQLNYTAVNFPDFVSYEPNMLNLVGVGEGFITYGDYTLKVTSTLPTYGIYSAPQRTVENYMATISNNPGVKQIVYLMWAENATPAHEAEVVVNGEHYGKSMCEEKTDTYLKISFEVPDVNWIAFNVKDGQGNQLTSFEVERTRPSGGGGQGGNQGQQNTRTVNLENDDTPVTVGIAAAMGPEGDLMVLNNEGGASVTYDPNHPDMGLHLKLCVGAIVNFGNEAEAVANQGIYDEILENPSITVKKWENFDGSDPSEPNIKMATPYKGTVSGVETLVTEITADPLKLGMCQLELTFTYDEQVYKTYYNITYENPDMSVNVSEDTDLAEVLSSSDNLIKWLEDNHLDALRAYGGDGFVNINLPAKVYDYPIEVNIDEPAFRRIRIRGCADGTGRTVMRSLTIKQGVFAVDDIDFVAGNSGNQVALIHDNDAENYHSTLGTVSNCTFQGYPVGVKDIGYGHIRYISDSLFYNCDASVIIHPETTGAGNNGGTIEYHGNTFMNTDVAISLEALPVGISAYRTQFNDNTFLFCDLEFNMVPTGTFYFMRNYYGGHERGNEKYEDWKHPGNKADEQIRHHARIQEADKSGTKTVTNPVRKTIDTPCEYWIYTGEDQHTAIFNAESARMLIDGATFGDPVATASSEGVADKDMPVSILDNNGNELAKWTF